MTINTNKKPPEKVVISKKIELDDLKSKILSEVEKETKIIPNIDISDQSSNSHPPQSSNYSKKTFIRPPATSAPPTTSAQISPQNDSNPSSQNSQNSQNPENSQTSLSSQKPADSEYTGNITDTEKGSFQLSSSVDHPQDSSAQQENSQQTQKSGESINSDHLGELQYIKKMTKTLLDEQFWEDTVTEILEEEKASSKLLPGDKERLYVLKAPWENLLELREGKLEEIQKQFVKKCKEENLIDTEKGVIRLKKSQKLRSLLSLNSGSMDNLEALILLLVVDPRDKIQIKREEKRPCFGSPPDLHIFRPISQYEEYLGNLYL